jgi:hypothetical protein
MSTAKVIPFTNDSVESTSVMERYREAYQTAEKGNRLRRNCQARGHFLGGDPLAISAACRKKECWRYTKLNCTHPCYYHLR